MLAVDACTLRKAACAIYSVKSTHGSNEDNDTVDGKVAPTRHYCLDNDAVLLQECTVNHCALLHLLESGGNRTQDQPISALHSTDGFRAHGNLTPSVDDGSLQRKCFKVGVLNFALFNNGEERAGGGREVLSKTGGRRSFLRRHCAPAPPRRGLSQRQFRLCVVGFELHVARRRIDTHAPGRPLAGPPSPPKPLPDRLHERFAQHGFRIRARAPRRRERV